MWQNEVNNRGGGGRTGVCECERGESETKQNSSVMFRTRSNFSVSLFFAASASLSVSACRTQSKQCSHCNRICNTRDSNMNISLKDDKTYHTLNKLVSHKKHIQ